MPLWSLAPGAKINFATPLLLRQCALGGVTNFVPDVKERVEHFEPHAPSVLTRNFQISFFENFSIQVTSWIFV
jgi:hypothetical protein